MKKVMELITEQIEKQIHQERLCYMNKDDQGVETAYLAKNQLYYAREHMRNALGLVNT